MVGKMIVTPRQTRSGWFIGLLLMVGVQLIFGMIQDGEAIVFLSQNSNPAHDRSCADSGRSADLLDETQEQEDSVAGSDNDSNRPLRNPVGLRICQPLMFPQLQLTPGPFRPPRLFQ
jgi:hypothetical protein